METQFSDWYNLCLGPKLIWISTSTSWRAYLTVQLAKLYWARLSCKAPALGPAWEPRLPVRGQGGSAGNQGFGNSEEGACKLRELERPGNFLEEVGLEGWKGAEKKRRHGWWWGLRLGWASDVQARGGASRTWSGGAWMGKGEESVDMSLFCAAKPAGAAPWAPHHHPPSTGEREVHTCSSWQPPQGSLGII